MSLIGLIVVLIVVGVLAWAVGQLPIDSTILKLIRVVIVVALTLWLLSVLFPGALGSVRLR